jgi:DNA-binding LacI/PurR family transcriptional regulator
MPTAKKPAAKPIRSDVVRPKHALMAEALDREIRHLPPGTPISPVLVLMERFGLSQGTVVHALRHLRTKGLITKIPGKKRLVVAGRGKTRDAVLSVLALCPNWSSPDYNTMLQALADEARRQRFSIETVHYGTEWGAGGTANLESAIEAHDAVVILPSSLPNTLASLVKQLATPAVMLFEEGLADGMMCVEDDDEAAGRLATEYLLGLGHRKIVAFQSEPAQRRMNNRLAGWRTAMLAAGEKHPERLVIDGSVKPGFDSIVGSYEKLRRRLYQNDNQLDATAIFCLHWTGSLGVLRALKEVGLQVPGDVSVIAHAGENRLTEFTNPGLTVVRGDPEAAAREALGMLKAACLGDTPHDRTIRIGQTIVERESTREL